MGGRAAAAVRRPWNAAARAAAISGLALLAAAVAAAAAEPAGDGSDTGISLDTSQAAFEGDWVVVAVAGLATWRPRGDASWQPIVAGEVLPAPSEIETGPTGQVTLVLGGDRLAVAPGSRLVLIARRPGEDQRLRQERGRLRVDIEPRPGRAVEVRTPLLSLGIKGTSFEVAVGTRQSSVLVLDGRVTVSTAGGGPPIELAPRQGLSQPTDLRQPARRLEVPDLPAAFDRAGPVPGIWPRRPTRPKRSRLGRPVRSRARPFPWLRARRRRRPRPFPRAGEARVGSTTGGCHLRSSRSPPPCWCS